MTGILLVVLTAISGYIWGAIPFGFLFVRWTKGIDLRSVGSGRTGGTNSMRAAGPVVGALTGLSDVLKGACAIWFTRWIVGDYFGELLPWVLVVAGTMTIVGHNWSIFLRWGGGAGTGPNIGWASAVWLPMFPIGVFVVLGALLITGMASVASLMMAITIPIVFGVRYLLGFDATLAYTVGGIFTALIVAWALRPNIKRLLAGNERVVGPAAKRRQRRLRAKQVES